MRPALVHPELPLALSPARLQALLVRFGAPATVAPGRRGARRASLLALARALFTEEIPEPLRRAFFFLLRLAHHDGREAILEAAAVVGYAVDREALAEGPADLAASVLLDPSEAARRTERRAIIRVDRLFVPRPSYELAGRAGAFTTEPAAVARALERAMKGALDGARGSDLIALVDAKDDRGCLHLAVFYRAPAASIVTWEDGALVRVSARPVHVDVARVDPTSGRFHLTTVRPAHLVPLARATGAALHGDPGFFRLTPSLSLKRLFELGAAGFAKLPVPPGLRSWSVVGSQWMKGDDARIEARADDALSALETSADVASGYFARTTVRLVRKASPAPVDVFVQLPHTLTVSDPRFEELARCAIATLDVFLPGALSDNAYTLAPWVHPEWRWREVLGDAYFEELVAAGTLVRVATRGVGSEDLRMLARGVRVTEVPGEPGVRYATPEGWSLPARDVRDEDTAMWAIDKPALGKRMREAMGLVEVPADDAMEGVLEGVLELASGKARLVYPTQRPRPGFLAEARRTVGLRATLVLLVPRGRRLPDEGVLQVELDLPQQLGAGSYARALALVARGLGVEDEIPAFRLAEPHELLVLQTATESAWLLGVRLELTNNVFCMLLHLARAGSGRVTGYELGAAISKGASYPEVVVRRTRERLPAQLRASFAAAGRVLPESLVKGLVVLERPNFYRLGVGVRVC